jgi:hypothetical protein
VRQVTLVLLLSRTIERKDAMLRGFTDSTGVEWRVWEVFPSRSSPGSSAEEMSRTSLMGSAFANGWLCFESLTEKRRLAPIPDGWERRSPRQMEELWLSATPVPARRASDPTRVRA